MKVKRNDRQINNHYRKEKYNFWVFALIMIFCNSNLYGQQLDERLSAFESIINKEWYGKTNNIDIYWSMEPILNGKGVRKKLEAPIISITSETTIYWDIKSNQLSFLRITSQGFILEGKVTVQANVLILEGLQTKTDSQLVFKNTLEIVNENKIIDIGYDSVGGIGHNIEYIVKQ